MVPTWQKVIVLLLGLAVGLLAVVQFVLGRILLTGTADIGVRMAHEHSGYTLTVLSLIYVCLTVYLILRAGQPSDG